jgi:hypothetical protein
MWSTFRATAPRSPCPRPVPSRLGEQGDDGKKQATVGLGAIKLAEDKWNFIVMFPQKLPAGAASWTMRS